MIVIFCVGNVNRSTHAMASTAILSLQTDRTNLQYGQRLGVAGNVAVLMLCSKFIICSKKKTWTYLVLDSNS